MPYSGFGWPDDGTAALAVGQGWDSLTSAAAVPAGLGGMLADPCAPIHAQEFYFVDPLQLRRPDAPVTRRPGRPAFDVEAVRRDFPILAEYVNGHRLVWLDNAATTQKPQEVIDRLAHFYAHENSNIHRAAHELAARATQAYEEARGVAASFLGAPSSDDIVFARGTTEAINLVAQSWGRKYVSSGDEIVLSYLEHHANIVRWQMLAEERGATLRVVPVDDSGQIILDEYRKLLTERTRMVAIAHVSNALGTIVPLREVIDAAHDAGAAVLVDGAQAVSQAAATEPSEWRASQTGRPGWTASASAVSRRPFWTRSSMDRMTARSPSVSPWPISSSAQSSIPALFSALPSRW